MRNKVIVILLIICIFTGTINPKKSQATGVEIAIVIGVEVVNYLVLASIASGVAVEDIYEKKNENDGAWISVMNKDGDFFDLPSGAMNKLKAEYAKSLVDSLSKTQLRTLSESITVDKNKFKVKELNEEMYSSINSMNDLLKKNPKLQSYMNNNTLNGKAINQKQWDNVKDVLGKFSGIDRELFAKNPYWALFPSIKLVGNSSYDKNYYGYSLIMSEFPILFVNRQANETGEYKTFYYTPYDYISDDYITYRHKEFKTNNGINSVILPIEHDGLTNDLWDNNITVIGNGVMNLGCEQWLKYAKVVFGNQNSQNWSNYVDDVTSGYYSIPTSTLLSLNIDTYMPYPKDNVRVKENEDIVIEPISTLENIDELSEYVIDGSVADINAGRTIDNTDSVLRSGLTDRVIDWDKQDTIPGTGDTTIDLTNTNERLDKILEKLGQLVGSVEGIDALTDTQLRDILDELELEGANALTVEQVRELMNERDKAQGVELEHELDLKKYEVDSGIINKFPFCIPFDLVRVIKKMDSAATAPRFEFPFKFQRLGINETIVLDLSQFEKVAVVVRWFVLVSYLLLLIYATRSLIKG